MISRLWSRPHTVSRRLLLEQLEERVVLDAAPADVDNANTADQQQDLNQEASGDTLPQAQPGGDASSAQGQSEASDSQGDIFNQDLSVVLISNALDQFEALADAAVDEAEVIVYDAEQDNLGDIVDTLTELVESTGQEIGQLAIISHGAEGVLSLGDGEFWTLETIQADSSEWAELGGLLADDAVIDLYGCNIGQGEEGALFVETLGSVTDADVRASDDTTGNVEGADWDLEVSTEEREIAQLIDDAQLDPGTIRLAEIIVAAGDTYDHDLTGTSSMDTITVNGTVTGNVDSVGQSDIIEINGTVTGNVSGGDEFDTVTNNGLISGNLVGGTGDDLIVNDGDVEGTIYGVDGSDTIIHTGYATKIAGQGGNDTIITSGEIATDIKAGSGNDTVSWYGGNVGGVIDGQRGTDELNLYLPAGTASYTYSGTANAGTLTYDGETLKWKGFETVNLYTDTGDPDETTANDDDVTIDEDHDVSFDVLVNDTVSDAGGSLTVVSIDTSTMNFPDNLEEVANGKYIYHEFSTTAHIDHDYLAVGETATETFTYTIEDEEGVTSTATVTITFTGLNDDPQLWFDKPKDENAYGSVTEGDGVTLTCTGDFYIQDIDTTNTHTVTFSYNEDSIDWSGGTLSDDQISALTEGTFSVDYGDISNREDQSWTYTVENSVVEFLAAGETVVFTYDLMAIDNSGGTSDRDGERTVTITIYGANSDPEAADDSYTVDEDASISGNVITDAAGQDTDTDATDTLTATLLTDPTYGTLTAFNSDGSFTFTADDNHWDSLAEGQIEDVTFTYEVSDGHGGTSQATVTISVTGIDDAVIIGGDLSGSLTEDESGASGVATVSDVDGSEDTFQVQSDTAGVYGTFSIDASGDWTYTRTADLQDLNQGDDVTDYFTVTSEDGTASETVTITITGLNDNASIGGDLVGGLTEDESGASGVATVSDVDDGEDVFQVQSDTAGVYGTFSIDASGDWTYTRTADLQDLNQGDDVTDYFTVTSEDGTASETVTITITGLNDNASIGGDLVGGLTEDESGASGVATVSDVDDGEDVFQVQSDTAGVYGTFSIDASGDWTYTRTANLQDLNQGDEVTDNFTVTSADGTASETVTITITGLNDDASISGDLVGGLTEDESGASGVATVSDVDDGEAEFQIQSDTAGVYGTFSIDASGDWTYTRTANLQDLNQGDEVTDNFTVTSADGTASETVTITITGLNDVPTSSDNMVTTDEDVVYTFQTADFTFNDVDTGDTIQFVKITDLPGEGTLRWKGSPVEVDDEIPIEDINGGHLVFVPEPDGNGDPYAGFDFQVSDGIDYSVDSYIMSIDVDSVNDAPEISAPTSVTSQEDTSVAITGISISDVDMVSGAGEVQVTLRVDHGILTLGQTMGLTIDAGANGSSSMTFTGLLADVNAALGTLTFTPVENYYGGDTLDIKVNDQGGFGSGGELTDARFVDVTVISVPEFDEMGKSYLNQSYDFTDRHGTEAGSFYTAGAIPEIGNLINFLSFEGLLPVFSPGKEGSAESLEVISQFETLLHEALLGKNQEAQDHAWSGLFAFVFAKKSQLGEEEWLDLEEFLQRLQQWRVGKSFDEILLVFNAKDIELVQWFNSLMSPVDDALGNQQLASREPGEYVPESRLANYQVFDPAEMRVADLLLEAGERIGIACSHGPDAYPSEYVCRIFDLDFISFGDILAS